MHLVAESIEGLRLGFGVMWEPLATDEGFLSDMSGEDIALRTYVSEARFFASVLQHDLSLLPNDARIIEVGSGIGLLALCVAHQGFRVTAYEPQSAGFGEMHRYRQLIHENWQGEIPKVVWRDTYLTEGAVPPEGEHAKFAFAVNVVEHVPDLDSFFKAVVASLAPGGTFRFICPNYAFPYEPHFEIPTFLNKHATFRVFEKKIRSSTIADPLGAWDELSWPTVLGLAKRLRRLGLRARFSRAATSHYLRRVTDDASFVARKGPVIRSMFRGASAVAPVILKTAPISMLPIIDCTIRCSPDAQPASNPSTVEKTGRRQ